MWASRLGFKATATTGDPGIEVIDADGYVVVTACCPCCGEACASTEIDAIPMSGVWVAGNGGSAGAKVYLFTHKPVVWVGAVVRSNGTVPVTLTGFDVYASADHGLSASTEVFVYGPFSNASDGGAWGVSSGCSLPVSNEGGLPMTLWPGEEAVVWVKIVLSHHHCSGCVDAQGNSDAEPDCGCPSPIRVDVSITPVTEGSQ